MIAAVDSIALCDGGDLPEAQINALWEIGSGAIAFRPDSSRIVAWFGDAAGHDPSGGHTEADATTALRFGPYASGTTFKLTQAPGGKVEVKPFTGSVQTRFTLNGDAELIAIDASGNTATTVCTVAPHRPAMG